MIKSYKLLPKAYVDLENIWLYGLNQWGGVKQTLRNEFEPPVRIHHHGRHLIVYQNQNEHILIIRILHDSMDIEQHL